MAYTKQQITAVIDVVGAETFINHVLGSRPESVSVGMQLSHDNDGVLSQAEKDLILSL